MEILWLLYSAFTSILPTGSQDLENKDMKPFLIQIGRIGIITNASVSDEGTSWSHGLKSVQKPICKWTEEHLPLPTQKKHKHSLTQPGNSDFETFLGRSTKSDHLWETGLHRLTFTSVRTGLDSECKNHTSFQWLELTVPTLCCVSLLSLFLCLFSWSACNLIDMLHFS